MVVEAKTSPVFPQSVADHRGGRTSLSYSGENTAQDKKLLWPSDISHIAFVTRIFNDFREKFGQWGYEVKNIALDFMDIYWVYDPKNILTKEDKDKNLVHFNQKSSKQSAKKV